MMPDSTNTYGKNVFREVRVRCGQCQGRKVTNMQCDTGRYRWPCDLCGEDTWHIVTEVKPRRLRYRS